MRQEVHVHAFLAALTHSHGHADITTTAAERACYPKMDMSLMCTFRLAIIGAELMEACSSDYFTDQIRVSSAQPAAAHDCPHAHAGLR